MLKHPEYELKTGRGLIACPRCDALYVEEELNTGETARCLFCAGVLAQSRDGAFTQIIALAITTMILITGAIFFPFLEITKLGLGHSASLFQVALAFSEGFVAPLTVAIIGLVVVLPAFRSALLVYTLWPLARGKVPYTYSTAAFRLSEQMKPWSMAEIFIIGTAVAMVKIGGLATVKLGPAFWALCALILVNLANRSFMCSATIWDALEDGGAKTDGRELVETK